MGASEHMSPLESATMALQTSRSQSYMAALPRCPSPLTIGIYSRKPLEIESMLPRNAARKEFRDPSEPTSLDQPHERDNSGDNRRIECIFDNGVAMLSLRHVSSCSLALPPCANDFPGA